MPGKTAGGLLTCCSDNPFLLLYCNQSKKENQTLSCSTAHWISGSPVLDWAGDGTNVLQSKIVPSEDHALFSLQHILYGCWELFESPGSLVMLSPELSGISVTAAGADFGLFGRWDLASSSAMWPWNLVPAAAVFDLDQEGEWSGTCNFDQEERMQIQSWISSWWGLRRACDRPACHRGEINAINMKD